MNARIKQECQVLVISFFFAFIGLGCVMMHRGRIDHQVFMEAMARARQAGSENASGAANSAQSTNATSGGRR